MSTLATRYAFPAEPGLHALPAAAGLQTLGFDLARVTPAAPATLATGADEALLVVLESSGAAIEVDGQHFPMPDRTSVFDELPTAVYVPPGHEATLSGTLLAGVFRAPAGEDPPGPYLIAAADVRAQSRGSGNFAREVRDILPADRPATRLLVGETINPPGNWSSSPPHKHDRNAPPQETELEEIYLYRVDPAQGFGLQLSYRDEAPAGDVAHRVQDLDIVAIPSGYHPVVAGPGYRLYYLWGLAGAGRELRWFPDPAHAWVEGA
jgi:5-deoxy-glucuronate isomerase